MPGISSPISVSTKLQRIAELARQSPSMVLTTLAHHIDEEFLREAYRRTRKDGAPGVDRQTAEEYAAELEVEPPLAARPLQVGDVPGTASEAGAHPEGRREKTRPIGIPTFEDKVLQRAVSMVLEAVYEQEFHDCSYGFRPGRSAHQALQALWETLTKMARWVGARAGHPGILRLPGPRALCEASSTRGCATECSAATIDKWLKAGVMEEGEGQLPGRRIAAGRGDLAVAGERLPPRGARRLVREAGEAPARRAGSPHPLRGRCRHRLFIGGRRSPGDGSTCQSDSASTGSPSTRRRRDWCRFTGRRRRVGYGAGGPWVHPCPGPSSPSGRRRGGSRSRRRRSTRRVLGGRCPACGW